MRAVASIVSTSLSFCGVTEMLFSVTIRDRPATSAAKAPMETAIKGVPVTELSANPPAGIVNVGGEWYYDDYAPGRGVASLGVEAAAPVAPVEAPAGGPIGAPAQPEERNRILDLFRN